MNPYQVNSPGLADALADQLGHHRTNGADCILAVRVKGNRRYNVDFLKLMASMNFRRGTKYLVCQPLYRWPYPIPARLRPGIWVKSAPELPLGRDSLLRWALSGREIESLQSYPTWLCCEFLDEPSSGTPRQKRAIELVKDTRLAIQILSPIGAPDSTIFVFHEEKVGLGVVNVEHLRPWDSSVWGRVAGFDGITFQNVSLVVRGVHTAVNSKETRLVNPLRFLEHGLESTELHISIFLWVTALDSLLMAGESRAFENRLNNLLGENTLIFPVLMDKQPKYRVKDVARELFELRSCVAHGLKFPLKFQKPVGFRDLGENEILGYPSTFQHRQVLYECALFLLIQALRKIFLDKRIQTVRNTTLWRARLNHPF